MQTISNNLTKIVNSTYDIIYIYIYKFEQSTNRSLIQAHRKIRKNELYYQIHPMKSSKSTKTGGVTEYERIRKPKIYSRGKNNRKVIRKHVNND